MKNRLMASVVIFLCLVSGCAVVETTKLNSTIPSSGGVVYYLPTRPVKIEMIRAPAAATKSGVDESKKAVTAASEALVKADEALKDAKKRRYATDADGPARADADKAVAFAEADKKIAKGELTASQNKLAAVQAALLETLDGNPPLTDTMTVTVLDSVADTNYRYLANLKHYATRSDKLDIKTTAAGLLSTTTAKSEEQSAQILVNLAKSIAAAGGVGPGLAPVGIMRGYKVSPAKAADIDCGCGMKRSTTAKPAPFKFEYVFDPTADKVTPPIIETSTVVKTDNVTPAIGEESTVVKKELSPSPWEYVESSLCALGADYHFVWQSVGPAVKSEESAKETNAEGWAGLFYRRLLPYRLDVYKGIRIGGTHETAKWESLSHLKTVPLELPNSSPPELLPLMGTAFARRDFDTEFQNGLLLSHKEERPSEAMSIVAIPYDIIKAIIAVPAEIISLKVNYSSNEKELVEMQTKLLQAQKAYQDALKEKIGGDTPTQ